MMEQVHPQEPEAPVTAMAQATPAHPGQAQAPKPVAKKAHVSEQANPPLKVRGVRGVMSEKKDEDRGFLKGIRPSAFLDCYQEWHAFVEGLCEVLCPWPAKHKLSGALLNDLRGDHHYYMFGRAMGVIAWLIIATIIQEVFW